MEEYQEENKISKKLNRKEESRIVIQKLLKFIAGEVAVEEAKEEDNQKNILYFNIRTSNPGILIGHHGHTLDALQHLINIIINKEIKTEEKKQIVIDVENYREKRKETIKKYALEKAEVVKRTGKRFPLNFMNSAERKMVHLALQDNPLVITYSEGDEPYRRVVIAPREQKQ
ncbi:MAG: protein jag [Candidatus Caldatribacteriota bacterium]